MSDKVTKVQMQQLHSTDGEATAAITTSNIDDPDQDNINSIEHASPRAFIQNNERFKHDIESFIIEDYKEQDLPSNTLYYRKSNNGKKILFFEMKIKRIAEINTSKETFRCRFHIYFTWLTTKEECDIYDELKLKGEHRKYEPLWKPTFSWQNAIAVHQTNYSTNNELIYKIKNGWYEGTSVGRSSWDIKDSDFGFPPNLARWNRVRYEYDVEFAEEMELPGFPFDCQDLTMYLKADTDKVQNFDIVPFPRPGEFCLLDPEFSVLSEWDFESLVVEFTKTSSVKSKSSKEYALVAIHVKASRRWEAHIGHMIVIFCMFTLGLAAFSQGFGVDELGNRLSYCVTLLLADVATLQLVFDNLPNIPYWTIFDYYIYTCFFWLFLITGWTGLVGYSDYGKLEDWDKQMSWIAFGFYCVSHLIFIILAMRNRRQERTKLIMSSLELESNFKSRKAERDRRAIAVLWKNDCLEESSQSDKSGYGIFVKGWKKDIRDGRSFFTLLKL